MTENDWRNAIIEEAAKSIYGTRDDAYDMDVWEQLDSVQQERYVCDARAALAVFEKALGEATVTSTDDAMSHYTDPADPFWQPHPEPQGEPSDVQVVAALNAYWEYDPPVTDPGYWSEKHVGIMRAALRAASSVTEQGENMETNHG